MATKDRSCKSGTSTGFRHQSQYLSTILPLQQEVDVGDDLLKDFLPVLRIFGRLLFNCRLVLRLQVDHVIQSGLQ
jgi:hypothetical protein